MLGMKPVDHHPVWPNLVAQPTIMGRRCAACHCSRRAGLGLDLPGLLQTITERTRLLIVNAPNNPTGWTLTREEQQQILAHCRRTGTWILADEVYEKALLRAHPHGCAPSFLDIAQPEDRLLVAHSFSKSF